MSYDPSTDPEPAPGDVTAEAHAERWEPELAKHDPTTLLDAFQPGMTVTDSNGKKVGTIEQVYQQAGVDEIEPDPHDMFLQVDPGRFRKPLYIRAGFVADIARNTARLSLTQKEIGQLNWDPPEWIRS